MKYQIINEHFLSISAISISVYSVCLCMYNYYVHVHTHKIDSTSPVNQKLGTIFFLLFKTFHTCIFVTKNEFFIFFFLKNNFYCYNCFLLLGGINCLYLNNELIRNIFGIYVTISLQKSFLIFSQQLKFNLHAFIAS